MKRLLIVVDYQFDFVDGVLGYEGAADLEGIIYAAVKEAEGQGDEIVFTRDIHFIAEKGLEEGDGVFPPHCIASSGGEEFYGCIKKVAARHIVFAKQSFASKQLGDFIARHRFDRIDLCGSNLVLNVLPNAKIALESAPDAVVSILAKATGCKEAKDRQAALDEVKRLGIAIIE